MTDGATGRFPWGPLTLLGLLTIVGYGSWHYAFGVLLEPIVDDTGWSEEWLVAAFSITGFFGALNAPVAGRVIDGGWARPALAVTGLVAGAGLVVASTASSLLGFAVASGVSGAALSAFAFYHVTQTLAARLSPDRPTKAVGVLTLYGAFASTVYLPLTAVLVERADWRFALRTLGVVVAACFLAIAAVLPSTGLTTEGGPGRSRRGALLTDPRVRRYAVASFAIGIAVGIIDVYQVPIMSAAGLSLTTAAWLAGSRGIAQFVGRLPVIWLAERLGSTRALRLAFAAIGAGGAVLAVSSHPVVGLGFVALAGTGIGATSPLQGMHAATVFPPARLGEGMGVISLVFGVAWALGPTTLAVLSAGSVRWPGSIAIVVAAVVAVFALRSPSRPPQDSLVSRHPEAYR